MSNDGAPRWKTLRSIPRLLVAVLFVIILAACSSVDPAPLTTRVTEAVTVTESVTSVWQTPTAVRSMPPRSSEYASASLTADMPAKHLDLPQIDYDVVHDPPVSVSASDGSFLIGRSHVPSTSVRPLAAAPGTTCTGPAVSDANLEQGGTATDPEGTCYQLGAALLLYNQIVSALVEKTLNGTWAVNLHSVRPSGPISDYTAKYAPPATGQEYQTELVFTQGSTVVAVMDLVKAMDGSILTFADLATRQDATRLYTALTGYQPPA